MSDVFGAAPSVSAGALPPPPEGEDFRGAARRMAGLAGLAFGWEPEVFWRATPDELMALVEAMRGDGEGVMPPDATTIARLMEAFPDG